MDGYSKKVNESVPIEDKRRGFLKAVTLMAGGFLAMGTIIGKAFTAFAEDKTVIRKREKRTGAYNTPDADSGQITGPIKDHRWMGWMNQAFDAEDGWNNWENIENPNKLPIWHDNFHAIRKTHPKHHWAMVMDLRRCVGCQACVIACKSENNVPLSVFRTVVDVTETGRMEEDPNGIVITDDGNYTPNVRKDMLPRICNHCDAPPCVEVCPVKATFKRQDGIVLIDYNICIGCGTCVQACPYDMRFFNPVQRTADKCTLCVHRIDRGLEPACVTSCVGRARVFGDLNDPKSRVSRLISSHPVSRLMLGKGTDPQVFYIDLNGDLTGATDLGKATKSFTYTMGFNTTAYRQLGGKVELPLAEEKKNPYES